jgi:hypothetical protein
VSCNCFSLGEIQFSLVYHSPSTYAVANEFNYEQANLAFELGEIELFSMFEIIFVIPLVLLLIARHKATKIYI